MADVPQYTTVARPKDYWMSPRALSITLNARSEANRIAASASSGAQFFCHFEDIGDAQAEELFGYDVGHNFRSWPLAISPTYFNTNNAIYPHIAIPRTDRGDSLAMVVFPTVVLDLWGYETETEPMQDEDGNYIDEQGNIVDDPDDAATAYVRKKKSGTDTDADPVGSEEYYYIYLHGKLLAPFYRSGSLVRDWDPEIDTGRLNTDETWGEVITLEQLAREMKKKVDVEWFQRVFKIHGTGKKRVPTEWDDDGKPIEWETDDEGNIIYEGDDGERRDIKPNDMDHEITDTESMFGTWTQHWLSALGIGSGSGGSGGGGGGGDALDEPLLSINQMVATPTQQQIGYTLVWKGNNAGINNSGWDFGQSGMSQQEADARYLKLQSQTEQRIVSNIDMIGNFTLVLGTMKIGYPNASLLEVYGDILLDRSGLIEDNSVLTKADADSMYVSVAFFESLFELHSGASGNPKINTNTDLSTYTAQQKALFNIKAMFGTWTEQYLSALGIGSGGSGGAALSQPLLSINQMERNPSELGQTLVWGANGWDFGMAGLDADGVRSIGDARYLRLTSQSAQTVRSSINLTGTLSVTGDITLSRSTQLGQTSVLTKGDADSMYVTVAFWNSLFETYNGTTKVNVNTENPTINNLKILVGTWTEQYLSALGIGSGGGGGTPLNSLLMSLNDTSLSPTSTGYTNAVLVNTNGAWSWKEYGGGSVTNLKTLTVKVGTTNAVVYNPADTQAATLTVSGQKVNNTNVLTVTAGTGTLAIALADNYGDTKNPYAAKSAHYVLAGPASGNATAPEFRQLAPSDISNLSLDAQTGLITIGSNTITPLTDATLKNDYEWWGGKLDATTKKREGDMSNVGNIKIDNDAKISWKKAGASNYLSMLTLDTYNNFIVGESMASSGYTTYLRGRSITFQTGTGNSGNHTASMSNAGLFTVEKLKIGSIVISEDTQNGGLHVESAGIYADTYVSSLGTGSGGGGGTPLNSLLMSLNDASGVQNPTSVSNKVLVNNRGTWSWETYGGGGSGTIGGASDKADYFTGYVANSAAKLSPGKKINGTTFTGESDITTDKWGTARTITIKDNDATNQQANTNIDGSADFILKLPASIKATLTGNADTATKLKTARTLWGNSFDGSQSIGYVDNNNTAHYANLNFVGSITMNSSITGCTSIDSLAYFFTTSGSEQLRVSSSSPSAIYSYTRASSTYTPRLYVDGNIGASGEALVKGVDFIGLNDTTNSNYHGGYLDFHYKASTRDYTTRIIESASGVLTIQRYSGATGLVIGGTAAANADYIKIGGATITWDNTNQALHIDKGVYSDTYVSALGIGSGGGGGGGMTEDQMWVALGTNGQAKQITLTHLTLALQNYAKTDDVTKTLTFKDSSGTVIETYDGKSAKEVTLSSGDSDSFCQIYRHELAAGKVLKITFGNRYHAMVYGRGQSSAGANIILTGVGYTTASNYWRCIMKGSLVSWRTQPSARGIEVSNGSSGILYISVVAIRGAVAFEVADALSGEAVTDEVAMTSDIVKNTAGVYTSSDAKLYLIGSKSTSSDENGYAKTFTNTGCYISSDGDIYSNLKKVITASGESSQFLKGDGSLDSSNYKATTINDTTAGSEGYERLTIGNSTKLSAAKSKYGIVRIYQRRDTENPSKDVYYGQFVVSSALTNNRTYTLPNKAGTVAMTSDIPSTDNFVDTSSDQSSIGGKKTFTSNMSVNANLSCSSNITSTTDIVSTYLTVGQGTQNTSYNLYVSGTGYFTGHLYGDGKRVLTTNTGVTLTSDQTISGSKIFSVGLMSKSLCIETKIDGTADNDRAGEINRYGSDLHLQYHNQTGYTAGGVTMCYNGGCVAIGYSSQDTDYKLKVNGTSFLNGRSIINGISSVPDSVKTKYNNAKLCVNGNTFVYGTAHAQAFDNISDMRLKTVTSYIDDLTLTVEDIARAPIFNFTWNYFEDKREHVGTSAQYWLTKLPNVVDGRGAEALSMDYSATALAAAVMTARKVMDHEEQIAAIMRRLSDVEAENRVIKQENLLLRQEVELLKAA